MFQIDPNYPYDLLQIEQGKRVEDDGTSVRVIFTHKEGYALGAHLLDDESRNWFERAKGNAGTSVLFPKKHLDTSFFSDGNRVYLLVRFAPDWEEVNPDLEDMAALGAAVVRACNEKGLATALVMATSDTINLPEAKGDLCLRAFFQGMHTATYRCDDFKTEPKPPSFSKVIFDTDFADHELTPNLPELVANLAYAEHQSRRLIDLPAQNGCLQTEETVELIGQIIDEIDSVEGQVIAGLDYLDRTGLQMIRAVGQGSTHEPAAAFLHYKGAADGPTIALVGKWIVFDDGGKDSKGANTFAHMKSDMGGGAMLLSAFMTIVKLQLPVNIVLGLGIADNAADGNAINPGAILELYGGGSIEVGNTDAEGRLVMIDILRYIERNYKVDRLVTMATLTGACVGALGHEFGGLFCNSKLMEEAILAAASRSGDKVWPLPLRESRHIKPEKGRAGKLADHCSTGAKGLGGAISAAKSVLCQSTTEHRAHLDVAGPSVEGRDRTGEKVDFSSGYGANLGFEIVRALAGVV